MDNQQRARIPTPTPPQPRIEVGTRNLMLRVALAFDALQGVLVLTVVGSIIASLMSIFAWLTFYIWFKIHGITFMDSASRTLILWSGALIELLPGINILPGWTLSVLLSLVLIRIGDKKRIVEFNRNISSYAKKLS